LGEGQGETSLETLIAKEQAHLFDFLLDKHLLEGVCGTEARERERERESE
jgi:hypothetical protein